MALLGFDGYDSYGSATDFNQQTNCTTNFSLGSGGRTDKAFYGGGGQPFHRHTFNPSGSIIIVGMGITGGAWNGSNRILKLFNSNVNRQGLSITTNNVGQLQVHIGGRYEAGNSMILPGTTVIWTNTDTEPTNTWLHYELKVDQHITNGSWTLRRNGAVVYSQSGVPTVTGAGDVANNFNFECSNGSMGVDDVYWLDGSGTSLNDFLGPVRVRRGAPTGNVSVQMTPNTGTNWQAVDETGPDDDTTYVTGYAAGDKDKYTLADLPPQASVVRAVRTIFRARKEDAAFVTMRSFIDSGGTIGNGATRAIDVTYSHYVDYFPTNPNTGAGWTWSAANAVTGGVERIA